VFDVALAALHDGAAHTGVPRLHITGDVSLGEMQLGFGDDEFFLDAFKAQLAVLS
jgi:hypothetical protein